MTEQAVAKSRKMALVKNQVILNYEFISLPQ